MKNRTKTAGGAALLVVGVLLLAAGRDSASLAADPTLADIVGGADNRLCDKETSCTEAAQSQSCGGTTFSCGVPCPSTKSCVAKECDNDKTVKVCGTESETDCPEHTTDCGVAQKGTCHSVSYPHGTCGDPSAPQTYWRCEWAGPCEPISGQVPCKPKVCQG